MLLETAIHVSQYKSFGKEPQGFDQIKPINIIIGKNNSGKSALIDLIESLIHPQQDKINFRGGKTKPSIRVPFTEAFIEKMTEEYRRQPGRSTIEAWKTGLQQYINNKGDSEPIFFWYNYQNMIKMDAKYDFGEYQQFFQKVTSGINKGYIFRRLNAERDIVPEGPNEGKEVEYDGRGATNMFRRILTIQELDPNLVQKDLLTAINEVVNPEIVFTDVMVRAQKDEHHDITKWEIFFETDDNIIPLSKMGSGVKTVILTLLNLIVLPKLDSQSPSKYIFGLEELENNLHPALQRRLFQYIHKYCERHEAIFFITTHSNVAIDLFLNSPLAQVIHVQKAGTTSTCTVIKEIKQGRNILKDLDYKASDLLLSNGIIWVEGPSDAIYLDLFIYLINKEQGEADRLNFTIQALSTALWKYAGFRELNWDKVDANVENQLISLAKVNHNHLIVLDKDTDYEDKKPSEYNDFAHGTGKNKARLIHESMVHGNYAEEGLENNSGDMAGDVLAFWINEGTMESYMEYFIKNKGAGFAKYFSSSAKGYFEKKRTGDNHSISKVELAAQIAAFCEEKEIQLSHFAPDGSELHNKLNRLVNTIKGWNK